MLYLMVKIIHLFSVFIYAGFLFTDNLFLSRMRRDMTQERYETVREGFMKYVRKVVPKSLLIAVFSGGYLFYHSFGPIGPEGLADYQILMVIKGVLGLWLGVRGVMQVFFGIQPLVFKSHRFPFFLVILIILISQVMFYA